MIVSRIEAPRAFLPMPRWFAVIVLAFGVFVFANPVQAHAPFDSNARVIVMEQSLEATVVVGSGLAAELLKDSGVHSLPQSGVGMGTPLPLELASRFFEIEAAGKPIAATQLRVLSDGLESTFVVTFPRPSADGLKLHTSFAKFLPSASFCALVVTDDNNKMLGSHLVKLGSEIAEFALPKNQAVAVASPVTPTMAGAKFETAAVTATGPVAEFSSTRRAVGPVVVAIVLALSGAWMIRKFFLSRTNEIKS